MQADGMTTDGMTILEATVHGGQLVLDSAVPLPDGTRMVHY